MSSIQEKLENMKFVGQADGGLVTVVIDGNLKVLTVDLPDEEVMVGEIYMVEEAVVVAMNTAIEKALAAKKELLEGE